MKVFISLLLLAVVGSEKINDTDCPPEQENDWSIEKLLRHEDCEKFYKCTFGKPVEMLCPANLWFNLDTWQCDYPQNVDCSGRNEPTPPPPVVTSSTPVTTTSELITKPTTASTTPSPTTNTTTTISNPTTSSTSTTASETTTEIDFNEIGCPVDPHVHWLLPHETNCNMFYHCVWGKKVSRQCPSSLHFNKVIQVCDAPNTAGCSTSLDKNARRRREISSLLA